jgi:AmiR/NasT family two-component response regulator
VNERGTRRFSQAISEGDGISVLVDVADPDAARAAEDQGADGVVVRRSVAGLRDATELPVLWCADGPDAANAAGADACLLVAQRYREDWHRLAGDHARVLELGLDCVVEVRDEEELEDVFEQVDPEIVLLAGESADRDADPLDHVLELLPDVPAGKLAVAHVAVVSRDEVIALERAGIDAVIVEANDVSALVGDEPPEV